MRESKVEITIREIRIDLDCAHTRIARVGDAGQQHGKVEAQRIGQIGDRGSDEQVEYLQAPDYRFVPGVGIGSRGAIASVAAMITGRMNQGSGVERSWIQPIQGAWRNSMVTKITL